MPQQDLRGYTENQGTVSAGALPSHYTEQWDPSWWALLKEEPNQTFSLGWKHTVPGAQFSHMVTTTGEPEYSTDVVLRVFCHVITNHVPPKGLPALCETLKSFYDFYRDAPLLPARHALPAVQGLPASIGRVYTMQPFEVTED